jgi:hypothetical protein
MPEIQEKKKGRWGRGTDPAGKTIRPARKLSEKPPERRVRGEEAPYSVDLTPKLKKNTFIHAQRCGDRPQNRRRWTRPEEAGDASGRARVRWRRPSTEEKEKPKKRNPRKKTKKKNLEMNRKGRGGRGPPPSSPHKGDLEYFLFFFEGDERVFGEREFFDLLWINLV